MSIIPFRRRGAEALAITEAELRAHTRDLDDMHHDTMPQMAEQVAAWSEEARSMLRGTGNTSLDRRRFLLGLGAAVGGVASLGALSALPAAAQTNTSTTRKGATTKPNAKLETDLAIAGLAAALENLAVGTYQAALDAAKAGKLGVVPPAVAQFITTAQAHHRDHAQAWNAILTSVGRPAVTGVDITVNDAVVKPTFAKVKDVSGVAKLALDLEDVAAATYFSTLDIIDNKRALATAATIQPVEMQHSAILRFVLGQSPVPQAYATKTGARPLSDKIG